MKQSTIIDISDFIQKLLRENLVDSEYMISQIARFINEDRTIIDSIHAMLLSRLKYSTGRLYRSISVKASYSIPKGRKTSIETTAAYVNVALEIPDDLMNALLGKDEAHTPVPTVGELVKWIRGKEKYFKKDIEKITKLALRRRAMQMQRDMLIDKRDDKKPMAKSMVPKNYENNDDPIEVLAARMQETMKMRFEAKGSATLGSEYVFLGREEYSGKLSYHEMDIPLFTIKPKTNAPIGEINKYMERSIRNYVNTVISKIDTKTIMISGTPIAGAVLSQLKGASNNVATTGVMNKELFDGLQNLDKVLSALYKIGRRTRGDYSDAIKDVKYDIDRAANFAKLSLIKSEQIANSILRKEVMQYTKKIQSMSASDFARRR